MSTILGSNPIRRRMRIMLAATMLAANLGATTSFASPASAEQPTQSALSSMRADHVLIGVADFVKGVNWYTEKLGFKVEKQWTVDGLPGMQLAYLELNGFRVEVIGGGGGARLPAPATFEQHLRLQGYQHLCFSVADVDAAMAELERRGVEAFVPAESYSNVGVRVAFLKDPEGNVIELSGPIPVK